MPLSSLRDYSVTDVQSILRAAHFAAQKHSNQRRKSEDREPYVNHLIEVASILADNLDEPDPNLIIAGFLHDTIEDVQVTREQLAAAFGEDVASLVVEVTDDKTLEQAVRKELQVSNGPHKSARAQALSAADKIANLRSIREKPPAGWNPERRRAYFEWARRVVAGYSQLPPRLAAEFQKAYERLPEIS